MVGQKNLLSEVKEYISRGAFPRFSIFAGREGAGKKTLAKEVAKLLGCECVTCSCSVEDVTAVTKLMWEQDKTTVYCITGYENMHHRVKPILLKICEEPPNNSYIILTTTSKELVLPTILGRGVVFEFSEYSRDELLEIARSVNAERVVDLCEVPGDIAKAQELDIEEFTGFTKLFWDNIGRSAPGNALKVTSKLNIKGSGGYDIELFIQSLYNMNKSTEDIKERAEIYNSILKAKTDLQKGYYKLAILDRLILEIRSIRNGIS